MVATKRKTPTKRRIGYYARKATARKPGRHMVVYKVGVRGKPFYMEEGKRHYVPVSKIVYLR